MRKFLILILVLCSTAAYAAQTTVNTANDSFGTAWDRQQAMNGEIYTYMEARDTLGEFTALYDLEIGADVQAYDVFLNDIAGFTDPDADRLIFFDDSSGTIAMLTLGTNLSITDSTINAAGGGSANIEDDVYGVGWDTDTTNGASQNALYDYLVQFDADADGDFTDEGWFPSASGAPTDATYLTSSADAGLSAEEVVSANGLSLVQAADYAAMKALLDLEIGTDVEAYDTAIAKADETKTVTSVWTLNRQKYTVHTGEPTNEAVGDLIVADNDTWDPATIAGTDDYMVICTAAGSPGTYKAVMNMVTGAFIMQSLQEGIFWADGDGTGSYVWAFNTSASRTLTIPGDADQTITTNASTATLTNKTIDADDNTFSDMPYDLNFTTVDPADADIFYIRLQRAVTASSIGCVVDPEGSGESVVVDIQECDSNGDNCSSALSSTITCGNNPTAGTISDAAWDANDFLKIDLGTVTGTVKTLTIYGTGDQDF